MTQLKRPLSNRHAHRLLYCLFQIHQLPPASDGRNYPVPGYLRNKFPDPEKWDELNARDIRMMAKTQMRRDTCVIPECDNPISATSVGDHLIPTKTGGRDGAENYVALCPSHNSSKGGKDFLEWWHWKGWELKEIPSDLVCMYSRLRYRNCEDSGNLDDPAPVFLAETLRQELLAEAAPDCKAILAACGL